MSRTFPEIVTAHERLGVFVGRPTPEKVGTAFATYYTTGRMVLAANEFIEALEAECSQTPNVSYELVTEGYKTAWEIERPSFVMWESDGRTTFAEDEDPIEVTAKIGSLTNVLLISRELPTL